MKVGKEKDFELPERNVLQDILGLDW